MLGSSHTGERANAAALADRLVRQSGLTWSQAIGATEAATALQYELNIATANCRRLQAECDALRRRLAETRHASSSTGGDPAGTAKWILDLHERGTIMLTPVRDRVPAHLRRLGGCPYRPPAAGF